MAGAVLADQERLHLVDSPLGPQRETEAPRRSNPETRVSAEVGSRLTDKRVVLRTRSESCR